LEKATALASQQKTSLEIRKILVRTLNIFYLLGKGYGTGEPVKTSLEISKILVHKINIFCLLGKGYSTGELVKTSLEIRKILVHKINILCLLGKGYSTGEPAARMNGTFGYLGLITLLGTFILHLTLPKQL
jgi:hypothetical protein